MVANRIAGLIVDEFSEKKGDSSDSGYTNASSSSSSEDISCTDERKRQPLSGEAVRSVEKALLAELPAIPESERKGWALNRVRATLAVPETIVEVIAARLFDGDTGLVGKPSWLDLDKFRRGQKFAVDYHASMVYSELLGPLTTMAFESIMQPLALSGNASSPYAAFHRYLSTIERMHSWYTTDPWTPGTQAYNNAVTVRKMHKLAAKRLGCMSADELSAKTRIDAPWRSGLDEYTRDFRSGCPGFSCNGKLAASESRVYISQGDMITVQLIFVCFLMLNPRFFGIDYPEAEDDLEAICHVWRAIGYILGVDDDFNMCRGSLAEVRQRSRDIVQYFVKPSLCEVSPSSMHMMRCAVASLEFYAPIASFDHVMLDIAEVMGMEMPLTRGSMSYYDLAKYRLIRLYFDYGNRVYSIRQWVNHMLKQALERARSYDEAKLRAIRERSDRILADASSD